VIEVPLDIVTEVPEIGIGVHEIVIMAAVTVQDEDGAHHAKEDGTGVLAEAQAEKKKKWRQTLPQNQPPL